MLSCENSLNRFESFLAILPGWDLFFFLFLWRQQNVHKQIKKWEILLKGSAWSLEYAHLNEVMRKHWRTSSQFCPNDTIILNVIRGKCWIIVDAFQLLSVHISWCCSYSTVTLYSLKWHHKNRSWTLYFLLLPHRRKMYMYMYGEYTQMFILFYPFKHIAHKQSNKQKVLYCAWANVPNLFMSKGRSVYLIDKIGCEIICNSTNLLLISLTNLPCMWEIIHPLNFFSSNLIIAGVKKFKIVLHWTF